MMEKIKHVRERRSRRGAATSMNYRWHYIFFYQMRIFPLTLHHLSPIRCTSQHNLQATTTATALLTGGVGGHGGHVLDAANLEAGAGEGAEGRLATGAGALRLVATRRAHLDVKSGEPELLREKREREREREFDNERSAQVERNAIHVVRYAMTRVGPGAHHRGDETACQGCGLEKPGNPEWFHRAPHPRAAGKKIK